MTGALSNVGLGGLRAFKCNLFVHDVQKAAGVDVRLVDGAIPRAEDWHDIHKSILAYRDGKVVGEFKVIAQGDMSDASNLNMLRPGDIPANQHHVSVYVPYVWKSGAVSLPGYASSEIKDIGSHGSLADGEAMIKPHTISAATRDGDDPHLFSDPVMLNSGVVWNQWGFRPGDERAMVVRRFVPATR